MDRRTDKSWHNCFRFKLFFTSEEMSRKTVYSCSMSVRLFNCVYVGIGLVTQLVNNDFERLVQCPAACYGSNNFVLCDSGAAKS